MGRAYEAYVTLSLTKGFNILLYKNASVYFTVVYSHETSKYLPGILLSGLF